MAGINVGVSTAGEKDLTLETTTAEQQAAARNEFVGTYLKVTCSYYRHL